MSLSVTLLSIFISAVAPSAVCGFEIRNLGGPWLFRDGSGEFVDQNATVPGGIYSDLMNNNIIGNIYYGTNDTATRWVAKRNWTYYRTFSVTEDFLNHINTNLIFEGLDTFATVSLNDAVIGETRNMFVRYIFDIKKTLKVGTNTIEIQFASPITTAEDLSKMQDYEIPPSCPPKQYQGECHVNQIRKMQASFSWDWGPAFPSVGIWKDVYLEAFNSSVIRYITAVTKEVPEDSFEIQISTYLDAGLTNRSSGKLIHRLQVDGFLISQFVDVDSTANEDKEVKVAFSFVVPKAYVKLWWPNGFGDQNLYNLSTEFISGSEQNSKAIRIGFRKIELIQEPLPETKWLLTKNGSSFISDEATFKKKLASVIEDIGLRPPYFRVNSLLHTALLKNMKSRFRETHFPVSYFPEKGASFYFKVNNVPIFAKGANEIPLDILPERGQNPAIVKRVLKAAKETHMNMLRVWGGGVYESDFFYDTADELGILIWQDFMFACAMYPSYPEFLSNVVEEVRHQVKRLQHHASIALWAGNNENEAALSGNWYGTSKNLTLYKHDYVKLYVDTIRPELIKISNESIFLTSSPTNGKESDDEGHLAKNPQDPLFGDVHFYNYLLNSLDPSTYPVPRFASEYGYQSLPSVDSWLEVTNDTKNLEPSSDFMDHRQHHPLGLIENTLLINYQLSLPDSNSSSYYKAYIYFSQIVQACSIKFETELYRSYMGRLRDDGKGNTMGALYWQLNDVWIAPTWSGIDYNGRWKILQYFAKDFFAPTIITGFIDIQRQLNVYVVSDVPSLINTDVEVVAVIDFYKWNSFQPLNTTEISTRLETSIYRASFMPKARKLLKQRGKVGKVRNEITNLTPCIFLPVNFGTEEFGKSNTVLTLDADIFLASLGCGILTNAKTNCFFHLTLKCCNTALAPSNAVYPSRLKEAAIQRAHVNIYSVKQLDRDGRTFEIQIRTDNIALFVWLESHRVRGRFSENGFLMVEASKSINFTADGRTTVDELEGDLTITHLKDDQY